MSSLFVGNCTVASPCLEPPTAASRGSECNSLRPLPPLPISVARTSCIEFVTERAECEAHHTFEKFFTGNAGTVGVSAPTLDIVSGGAICSGVHRGRSNGLH